MYSVRLVVHNFRIDHSIVAAALAYDWLVADHTQLRPKDSRRFGPPYFGCYCRRMDAVAEAAWLVAEVVVVVAVVRTCVEDSPNCCGGCSLPIAKISASHTVHCSDAMAVGPIVVDAVASADYAVLGHTDANHFDGIAGAKSNSIGIAEWAQLDAVHSVTVADIVIAIQQLMSLRSIQIHYLERGRDKCGVPLLWCVVFS